jgi:hypothetical protein
VHADGSTLETQARLGSDTVVMMDKAATVDQRMGILRDNANLAQVDPF